MKYIVLAYIFAFILTSSCATRYYDPEINMSKEDYERKLSNKALGQDGIRACVVEPPIPRLSKIVALPDNPKFNEEKKISINVNEDVPIVDLLLEIGRTAEVDIVVDKRIDGSIFLSMKDRPLFDVLDRIAEFADLRYSVQNGTIVVEYDDPYLYTYDVSFLNMKRQNSSSMSVSTSVFSGGSMNGGSSASLSSSTQDTFWDDLSRNVIQVVNGSKSISDKKRGITTKDDNSFENQAFGTSSDQSSSQNNQGNTSVQTPSPSGGISNLLNTATGGGSSSSGSGSGSSSSGQAGQQGGNASGGSGQAGVSSKDVNVSKSTGLMSVVTSKKGHEKIEKYLTELKQKATAQVLIEIKLAEVTLSKEFGFGIDWSFAKNSASTTSSINTSLSTLSSLTPSFSSTSTFQHGNGSVTNAVNMLETFGTTKILASPRLAVLNNQQAILTFADNVVYFNISIATSGSVLSASAGSQIVAPTVTVTSTPKTIPVGIILSLQPSIDLKNKTIMLNVHPTISRIQTTVEDPGFAYSIKQAKLTDVPTNKIPVTTVREMDSVLNMKSEDIMVMGGFTERTSDLIEVGVPILSSIPLLKHFFSKKIEAQSVKEIVFIIKATIINENTDIHEYDKYFYKTFFNDPRELVF